MVSMLSFFYGATEPLFNNCFPPPNGGYDYLLFSSSPHNQNPSLDAFYYVTNENRSKRGTAFLPRQHHREFNKLFRTYSVPNSNRYWIEYYINHISLNPKENLTKLLLNRQSKLVLLIRTRNFLPDGMQILSTALIQFIKI